jgi:hypothetical protein
MKKLFNEIRGLLVDPYAPIQSRGPTSQQKIIQGLITSAQASYPLILVCLFIISFGNRPQAFKFTYTVSSHFLFFSSAFLATCVGLHQLMKLNFAKPPFQSIYFV